MHIHDLKTAYLLQAREILRMQKEVNSAYKGGTKTTVAHSTISIGGHSVPLDVAEEHLRLKKEGLEFNVAKDIAGLAQNLGQSDVTYSEVMVAAKKLSDEIYADALKKYPEFAAPLRGQRR